MRVRERARPGSTMFANMERSARSDSRRCAHCGVAIESVPGGGSTEPAVCAACGHANPPGGTSRFAPIEPLWPFSAWYRAGDGGDAPPCPRCGKPLRSADASRDVPLPGYCNPPWNAGWDGSCESCGARFELVVHTPLGKGVDRTATVRPASKPYRTFIDEGCVVSGVEVTVTESLGYGEWPPERPGSVAGEPRTERVFLSMAEIVGLARALEGHLSPYREQLDWTHDWT